MAKSLDQDRTQAVLVGGGISILLTRALILIMRSRRVLRAWVTNLAAAELALDVATLGAAIRWWWTNSRGNRQVPLKLAAAATILHAGRVLVFILGRLRPFKDFDVRPEHRSEHDERWSWGQVYFAAAMSVLGVFGVLVIRKRMRA